ncbi:FHA domain-containing protein [candidate division KSB1 bacterium]|nr:FHA domain-containing protein [candidate division KSB1 bacterium]NIR70193.1 FHA domain-containing protein [candidate division KSB1 bacterium]NIS27580.1 FHA domain-containing protein [candidate division KSB1 bacterium]NIT74432.1 FHA domain-containing protein [candidate division KSB1 bacterium]NIU28297.1 FHA domain-containing protein [candidate division KSB1 bacterium]
MPKLIVRRKVEVLREFDMGDSKTAIIIGTDGDNDLVIDDKRVSEKHAQIYRESDRYYIRDLNSAFGTYLNARKIKHLTELTNGDVLQLGAHTILFENASAEANSTIYDNQAEALNSPKRNISYENDRLFNPPEAKSNQEVAKHPNEKPWSGLSAAPEKADAELAPYYLLAVYGPYRGKRYQLRYGETKIGRDESLNDVILNTSKEGKPDQSISRRHATISYKNNAFFVSDKRSKTRTLVNQLVVPVDEEIRLYPKDEIEIVSDQQSTIFRFVEGNQVDFSFPRKAGVWWIRHRSRFMFSAAVLAVLLGIFFIANGILERATLTQKPDPLTVELSQWVVDRTATIQSDRRNGVSKVSNHQIPAVADFNGDGFVDIAITNVTHKPLLIDGQSKMPTWIMDTVPADPSSAFVAADINQDKLGDLIFLSQDGRLIAVDGKYGAEIWTSPFYQTQLNGPPVVADFDGDTHPDAAISDEFGKMHLGYNRVVSMEWTSVETGLPITTPLTSADIDRDGDFELIAGSERGLVLLVDGAAQRIMETIDINEELNRARGTFYEDNQIRFPIGIADLNGDETPDLVISTAQGRIVAISGATKRRLWYDTFTSELTLEESFPFPFALGDFDGDGLNDVIVCTNTGEIRAYNGQGEYQQPKLLWRQPMANSERIYEGIVVGDLTKDGVSDVIFSDSTGTLHVLNGRNGNNLLAVDPPFPGVTGMPLLADLRNDGLMDILQSFSKQGLILQYETNSRAPKSSVLWGQRFGKSQNTLNQSFEMPSTAKANVSMLVGLTLVCGVGGSAFFVYHKKRKLSSS